MTAENIPAILAAATAFVGALAALVSALVNASKLRAAATAQAAQAVKVDAIHAAVVSPPAAAADLPVSTQ